MEVTRALSSNLCNSEKETMVGGNGNDTMGNAVVNGNGKRGGR